VSVRLRDACSLPLGRIPHRSHPRGQRHRCL